MSFPPSPCGASAVAEQSTREEASKHTLPGDLGRVLSPSHLHDIAPNTAVRVGGRARRHPSGSWHIADALCAVSVEGASSPPDGCLALLDAVWTGSFLAISRIVKTFGSEQRCPEAIRLLDQGVGASLVARARALHLIRDWFDNQGFLEVQTPIRVVSPGLDVHLCAFGAEGRYLITSPEYHMKRLLVGGVPQMYQIVSCFRRDEQGHLHNSEFTMLEWYRAFAGFQTVMDDTERLVAHVARGLCGQAVLRWGQKRIDLCEPFTRITVSEAFWLATGLGPDEVLRLASHDEDRYFQMLVDQVEPMLADSPTPVMLTHFPAVHASLARRCPRDPRWCERFELYVAGVELCNGFGELTDPVEQRSRFEANIIERKQAGKPAYPIDERFLSAIEHTMPPSAGNALGVDRLIALCIGAESIAQVMAFPDSLV